MTGLIVDNVSLNDDVIIMIVAKTGAETTPPFSFASKYKIYVIKLNIGCGGKYLG